MSEKKGRRFPIVTHKTDTISVLTINLFIILFGLNVSEDRPHPQCQTQYGARGCSKWFFKLEVIIYLPASKGT
jgi:hypothetical protein